jgi:hypothetical protein
MAVAVHRRSTGRNETLAVPVRALAHVAWHRDIQADGTATGHRWTVSHLASGQSIMAGIRTRAHAVSLARYLESAVESWPTGDGHGPPANVRPLWRALTDWRAANRSATR